MASKRASINEQAFSSVFAGLLSHGTFAFDPLCASRCVAADEYAIGADLSFLDQAEKNGVVFKDDGQAKPGLQIFKDHGYNWIRLRLFHTPTRSCPTIWNTPSPWPKTPKSSATSSC